MYNEGFVYNEGWCLETRSFALMTLKEYVKKRDFHKTPEPQGVVERATGGPVFVIQEHRSSHHHFDLRLEHDGVLVSWAVPKGVPDSPGKKHLAVRTEDHPLAYADFEGSIPEGEYGAGEVKIWDQGTFTINAWEEDRIEVSLHGTRLSGKYLLVRFKRAGAQDWLVFRAKD